MNLKMKSIYATLVGAAIAGTSLPASAGTLITNWSLGTGAATTTGINQLTFGGESYVANTFVAPPPGSTNVSSTEYGVFNFNGFNNGNTLNTGGGQYTAVFNATDFGNLAQGTFHFTGGTLDIYYNAAQTYGSTAGTTAGNTTPWLTPGNNPYNAADGIKIGSFAISNNSNYTQNGGFINANGTPTSNGVVTVSATATSLLSPYWNMSNGQNLLPMVTLGFVTANASVDPSANASTYTIDPKLVQALSGVASPNTNPNNPPYSMFISNGGQFKLERAPEPGTVALLGIGLLGLCMVTRRRAS